MPENAKLLAEKIEKAFSEAAYPGDDKLVYDNSPEQLECVEVRNTFRGKHWNEIPLKVLQQNADSIFFFTPEAYRFYLPAYMIAAVISYRNADLIPTSVISSLTMPDTETDSALFLKKVQGFSPTQKSVIRSFLEFISSEHGADFPTGLPRKAINRFWRRY